MILSFRLGTLPVRIHPGFVVISMLLGVGPDHGPMGIAARAGAFVLAVFGHELAHALAVHSFGLPAEVVLPFARSALGDRIASLSPLRRVVVCLAGPASSLAVAALAFASVGVQTSSTVSRNALVYLGWISLGWGVLNLLPILPLDGGYALLAVFDRLAPGRGEPTARSVSIATALALASAAAITKMWIPALMGALVAFQNARALAARDRSDRDAIARVHLEAAFDALERGAPAVATSHCSAVLSAAPNSVTRKDAVRLLAYVYATNDEWTKLMTLFECGGLRALHDEEVEKYERAARELGRSEDAQRIAFLRGRCT